MTTKEFKQVILVRSDLKLPKGKLAAQVAHASVDGVLKQLGSLSGRRIVKTWRVSGMKKIVLKVSGKKELYQVVQEAKDAGLTTAVITDAGRTVVAPGTVTCASIGPADEEEITTITKDISLL